MKSFTRGIGSCIAKFEVERYYHHIFHNKPLSFFPDDFPFLWVYGDASRLSSSSTFGLL